MRNTKNFVNLYYKINENNLENKAVVKDPGPLYNDKGLTMGYLVSVTS
jgi:hypothetical protein